MAEIGIWRCAICHKVGKKLQSTHTHTHTYTHKRHKTPRMRTDLVAQEESSGRSSMEMHFCPMFLVYFIICGFMNNTDCQGRGRYCFLSCHMYCFISKHCSLTVLNVYDEDVCRSDPPLHIWIIQFFFIFLFSKCSAWTWRWVTNPDSSPSSLQYMQGPRLLQDQFPGVSTTEYFSPASKTHNVHIFNTTVTIRPKYFNTCVTLVKYFFYVFSTVYHSIGLFLQPTLMHHSITTYMSQ